jgi:hypothetical protein
LLNPVKAADLERILLLSPPEIRLNIANVFLGLERKSSIFIYAGIDSKNIDAMVSAWINKTVRLPLGVAFRVAKVVGVSAEVLFEWWIEQKRLE